MRIFYLSPLQTFILDIFAWMAFHLSTGYLSSRIPLRWLKPEFWFFQTFAWEKDGVIYERLFRVRMWKHLIPNGSALYSGSFSLKKLPSFDLAYLGRWLVESVRAELCHWIMIVPGIFFFLWNDVAVGWLMVVYAFLNNMFPIVMQRYNRPRMRKLLAHLEEKQEQRNETPVFLSSPKSVPMV